MRRLLYVGALIAMGSSATAQEAGYDVDYSGDYLCEMKDGGGVRFHEASGTWKGVPFNVKQTVAVHVQATFNQAPFTFYQIAIGDEADKERPYCRDRATHSQKAVFAMNGQMACETDAYVYAMNWKTMRFQYISVGTYVAGNEHDKGSLIEPLVAIGECRKQ